MKKTKVMRISRKEGKNDNSDCTNWTKLNNMYTWEV